ncbi:MAG: 4a-hydroxytetrahydrobiopterin dehydratase [Bacteroidota bacterium]
MEKWNDNDIAAGLSQLQDWKYENEALEKTITFKNFKEAFAMMTQIAFECEAQAHHPNWENVYNTLTIRLNTHDVGGITQKDFELAKTIDSLVTS